MFKKKYGRLVGGITGINGLLKETIQSDRLAMDICIPFHWLCPPILFHRLFLIVYQIAFFGNNLKVFYNHQRYLRLFDRRVREF